MKLFQSSQDRDLELLSAYIDDELSARERASLEQRLASDSGLRRTLSGLRRVQTTLQALPTVKPPKSFVLKPEMVGQTARQQMRQSGLGRLIPALNFATTLAAIVFAVVIGSQLATGQPLAAPVASQVRVSAPADGSTAPVEAPSGASSLKSLTAPAVTESAPTIMQAPACGNSTEEPLTGGGCGSGGGGGDTQVSPSTFSTLNGTGTATPSPSGAADTSVANNAATPESGPTLAAGTAGESLPPVASGAPSTGTEDQTLVGTPGPDTFSTTNNYAVATEPAADSTPAQLSSVTVIEYLLGGLLVILIIASILVRRR